MLGMAARRGRQEFSLARALLGYRSAVLSKSLEDVAESSRNWTSLHEQQPLCTKCLTAGTVYTVSDLSPQNGALRCASSRVFPSIQSQGVRLVSMSATGEEQRQIDLQAEKDPDYYMKSRYDQGSLIRNEIESGEELSDESVQLEEGVHWRLKRNSKGKFYNVVDILGDPQVLAAAHERLNERRRNWTLASNELEISHIPKENRSLRSREMDWNWFKEAAHQLRIGSYPFKHLQRLAIARRGRGESREWVCVRPKDQVIQEAIRGVLEKIYEPLFSSNCRPGANVHSALKSVKYGWKGISWFLQFDVRITDHSSVQKRLLKILGEKIEDQVFFDALRQMFKLGTIWIDTSTEEEMPEGSVLSPLLGNIYFHHLDLEIGRIREEIRCGSQSSLKRST